MTTDDRSVLPQRVGAARFQRYLGLIVGAFGLLYALQTLDALVTDWPTMAGPAGTATVALVAGSVLLGTVAGFTASRTLFLGAAVLFCAAVAVWPFAVSGPVPAVPMPWLVGMLPVQAVYLSVAFRRLAAPAACALSLTAAIVAVLVVRGGLTAADAVENGLFGVAISLVLIVLIAAVRRGVTRADAAQEAALTGYGRSRLDDATESERVRTDALVHDSVLTTFLAAAAARDPESEQMARRMAANALRVLGRVTRSEEVGPVVPFGQALSDAVEQFDPLLPGWEVQDDGLADLVLPVQAADAILTSMLHAITGSVRHSGATTRSLTLSELGPDGIRVVIADDGPSSDTAGPRATLHRSVLALMQGVDGRADVATVPHGGTVVTLCWGSIVVPGVAPRAAQSEVPA